MTVASELIDNLLVTKSEVAMSSIIAAAAAKPLSPEDVVRLAQVLAKSGKIISSTFATADLASTGGPGSLSTLLAPLYLRATGYAVPKLGIPGRPAGGIDVLAQLPGYRLRLSFQEIVQIVDQCGYAHFLADENFAPLDASFFRYRQNANGQNIPSLAAASLLAKKMACSLDVVGLDVRVAPHGNFGRTFDEAREASKLFCEASAITGIKCVAILTDGRFPYQPYIGRGEALLAMRQILERTAGPWLSEHDDRCRLMAAHVIALGRRPNLSSISPLVAFIQNIEAQGSSRDAWFDVTAEIECAPRIDIQAAVDGFAQVNIGRVRSIIENAHQGATSSNSFPDQIGVILHARPGTYVRRGDLLAAVRCPGKIWPEISTIMAECFKPAELPDSIPGVEGVVCA